MGKMLVTSSILGCLTPILTTVGLLGQKILRPARLPHEKYDLHSFYHQFSDNCCSDHLLAHKLFTMWKANRGYFPDEIMPYEHLFSRPAFRRLDESCFQICRELKNNFSLDDYDPDANSGNAELTRLVLASGFYPDVAIGSGKRNMLKLRKISSASAVPSSVNFVLGSGTISASLEMRRQRRDPHRLAIRPVGPRFFIYEELLDLGQKLVSKTTAVDPLQFILFSRDVKYKYFLSREGVIPHLIIDNWIKYRCPSETDLRLLAGIRVHWNEFIQFVIYKKLRNEPFTEDEARAVTLFKETILMLVKESDMNRKQMSDSSVECDRNGQRIQDLTTGDDTDTDTDADADEESSLEEHSTCANNSV